MHGSEAHRESDRECVRTRVSASHAKGGIGGGGGVGPHLDDIRGQGVHGACALHVVQHACVLAAAVHLAERCSHCRLSLHTLLLLHHTHAPASHTGGS